MQQFDDLLFGQGFEDVDAAAGEEGGDYFEGGVFGGCADEPNGVCRSGRRRQEGILLGFVEAMDFVDEEAWFANPFAQACSLGGHDLLDLLDAGEDGGEFRGRWPGWFPGDDFCEACLADAGRSPEDHGGGVVVLDLDAEGLAGAEQMLLTGVFGEVAGPHACSGERGVAAAAGGVTPALTGHRTGLIRSWSSFALPGL